MGTSEGTHTPIAFDDIVTGTARILYGLSGLAGFLWLAALIFPNAPFAAALILFPVAVFLAVLLCAPVVCAAAYALGITVAVVIAVARKIDGAS